MIHVVTPSGYACGVVPTSSDTLDSTTNVMAATCPRCVEVELSKGLPVLDPSKAPPPTCAWRFGPEFAWHTSCGRAFFFTDDAGPDVHDFQFCPYCGKGLVEKLPGAG